MRQLMEPNTATRLRVRPILQTRQNTWEVADQVGKTPCEIEGLLDYRPDAWSDAYDGFQFDGCGKCSYESG
jgi:hypothetical protein